jgi:hypothetical protein
MLFRTRIFSRDSSTDVFQVEVIGSILTLQNFPAPPSLSSNASRQVKVLAATNALRLQRVFTRHENVQNTINLNQFEGSRHSHRGA